MKNECSYVRDVLPLYFENMVSEDTAAFVEEHLKTCPGCFSDLEAMRAETKTEKQDGVTARALDGEALSSMKGIRRKLRRKAYQTAAIIAAIFIVFCVLLYYFPVYRVLEVGHVKFGDYYTGEEIAMALYIGSAPDRRQAQSVLRLADEAFNDVRHTRAENEEKYGLLARYATNTESYGDMAYNEHTLELWSAHLNENEGWLWVYYSSQTFDHDGSIVCGSSRVPPLWRVEKNAAGEWTVTQIREHP